MTTPTKNRPWFGRDPALWINAISIFLMIGVGFGLPINDGLSAGIVALLTVGATTWTAVHTRPWAPTIFTGLIGAGAALLAEFGLDATQEQVSMIAAGVSAVLMLIARNQITPSHDPRPLTAAAAVVHGPPDSELRR